MITATVGKTLLNGNFTHNHLPPIGIGIGISIDIRISINIGIGIVIVIGTDNGIGIGIGISIGIGIKTLIFSYRCLGRGLAESYLRISGHLDRHIFQIFLLR